LGSSKEKSGMHNVGKYLSRVVRDIGSWLDLELNARRFASDKNPKVREYACQELARIGNQRAVRILLVLLREEYFPVRAAAAKALGEVKAASALEALISVLTDSYPQVRAAAASALGEIGGQAAVGPLEALLGDPFDLVYESEWSGGVHFSYPVREAAEQALRKIHSQCS
jgi:HEAT repeat protein